MAKTSDRQTMNKTKIAWTDYTWNPTTGCSPVSAGCANCYAAAVAKRFWGERKFTDVRCHLERVREPMRCKVPSRIFVGSMSDLFHKDVPFSFIDKVWTVMSLCRRHTFQVLTKRPWRMIDYFADRHMWASPNIWLGVTVENNGSLWRIKTLKQCMSQVRFISFEPLLEPLDDLEYWRLLGIDWAIIGCESGPKHRPCELEWVETVIAKCRRAGTRVFVKQLEIDGRVAHKPEDWPPALRIREWPNGE